MEELYKAIGGLPGAVSLLAVAAALFWRFKVPQIGLDILQRELEVHRHEIEEADRDRQALRQEIKSERARLQQIERDYMAVLVERERLLRACRRRDRLLNEHGITLPVRDEET